MKNSNYNWIISFLVFIIVLLFAYLILEDGNHLSFSFSDVVSMIATTSSLILSVVAMLYTYFAGRDAQLIYTKTQDAITEIEKQVVKVAADLEANNESLSKMLAGTTLHVNSIAALQTAMECFSNKDMNAEEKKAIEEIKKTKNSMEFFLNKMRQDSRPDCENNE